MSETTELTVFEPIDKEEVKTRIYEVRGFRVMLDKDIAGYFGVTTGNLNKAKNRNIDRFPEHFCFTLTDQELSLFQSGIAMQTKGVKGGRSNNPTVYTENGVAMLTSVLHTPRAIQASIQLMEAFVEMRKFIAGNAALFDRISSVELKQLEYQKKTDARLEQIFEYIDSHEESAQKLFFDGQIYDAFSFFAELIASAEKNILLIDGYVDVNTLNLLAKKREGVSVAVYTLPKTRLTQKDVKTFNAQYPKLEVHHTEAFHDRFLLLDGAHLYHIGASLKDAGKKCFAVSRMEDEELLEGLLSRV